ncbi:ALP1-like protein [Tanacetum coccineum]
MQFIYVLPGWEGSLHDGRVLRDAISRPQGLRVPRGNYYLVDVGYCNANGFLVPYRGQPYHLQEFDGDQEYFNMKHSKARNVKSVLEEEDEYDNNDEDKENEAENGEVEYVTNISPSDEWLAFRNNICILKIMVFMVQMVTGTCDRGRGKNKQYWNEDEVEVLVDVLQELTGDSLWKVDGGFKNNYMVEYNSLSDVLMQSGCQWDDVENKVNCEKMIGISVGDALNEDEVFMVPSTQNPPVVPSTSHTKKYKKSPPT